MGSRTIGLGLLLCGVTLQGQTVQGIAAEDGASFNRAEIEQRQASSSVAKTNRRNVAVFPGDNVISHFADGGGWSSAVTLTNLDSKRLHARLLFMRDDGTDLILPIVGQGNVRAMDVTLDPTFTLTFETAGTALTTTSGWIYILKDGSLDAIGGMCVFRQRVLGRPDFEAVVPIVSEFDDRAVLIYDNTKGFITAAAFANPGSRQSVVRFTVRSEGGVVLEQKTMILDAYTHTAGTIPATFPSTVERRGSIEFTSTNFGVGVIGLRFNPSGAFTSFHVLSNINWLLN
jgi:hypothetical protein